MNDVENLINAIESGNNSDAKIEFNSVMNSKILDALETKRVDVASRIYDQPNEGDSE